MRETHKDLEWFGPPERNTLHPLCVVLPEPRVCSLSPRGRICSECSESCDSVCLDCVNLNMVFYCAFSPFYKPKGSNTLSGTPAGGPGDVL